MTQEKRIDFNKLSKPANLQNSAVLKMLEEEEERKRLGKPDELKPGDCEISSAEVRDLIRPRSQLKNCWLHSNSNNERSCQIFFRPTTGLRRVEWPPTKEGDCVDFVEQNPVQSKTRGLGEYATYQSKSPTLREEVSSSSTPKPNYPANPQQSQEQPRSWTPGTPTSAQQQPKEYIIPISSSWKSEAPKASSPLQTASKPKSWASVAPSSPQPTYQPQQQQQQQQQQQEYIVPVSCTWKTEAPTSQQVDKPASWSSAQPKEYIVPVTCPWKSEPTQPAPTFDQNQSWNKPTPSQFIPSGDLPTLNTWKPQAQSKPKSSSDPWAPRPQVQIQIKQTPPTPPLNTWTDKPFTGDLGRGDYPQQHSLTVSQEVQSPQSYKPQSSAAPFEPPATLITLRQEPPISQEPSPVYFSQPAATEAGYDGSSMGRGDNKWPPAVVKEQTEAENRARIELAKGPACRPRKVNKDYSSFFAQHAVTNNYPGYRAPPGTQYFTPGYQQ